MDRNRPTGRYYLWKPEEAEAMVVMVDRAMAGAVADPLVSLPEGSSCLFIAREQPRQVARRIRIPAAVSLHHFSFPNSQPRLVAISRADKLVVRS